MNNRLRIAICLALLGMSGSAAALTDSDVNSVIPFNFANPGARSLGMGGAFLALSDDATAAYTNPAGLTQLLEPEISVEGRHTSYSVPFVNGGSYTVDPLNLEGLHAAEASSSKNNISYLSVSFPHERWSFAAYRDELVHFRTDFASNSDGVALALDPVPYQTFPVTANAELKIVDYGVSAAFRAGDSVSIGAGLSYYDFDIRTLMTRVAFAGNDLDVPAGTPLNREDQSGSDNDVGVNLGARFVLSEHWSAGVTYRQGPKFGYAATTTVFDLSTGAPSVAVDLKNVRFKVPDQFGAGDFHDQEWAGDRAGCGRRRGLS